MPFTAHISTEAASLVHAIARTKGYAKPGLVVHRIGPTGDVRRSDSGQVEWSIERPNAWRVEIKDFSKHAQIPELTSTLDEGRIQLLLLPGRFKTEMKIYLREGELHAETPDA
jgi:hypothetical protein